MKYKPIFAVIFLLFGILQATIAQTVHNEACDSERDHAERVFAMAKLLSLNCDQLLKLSVKHGNLEAFCAFTRERRVNQTAIATSTENLRKYMKVCDRQVFLGVKADPRCGLLEKMQPDMEQLNKEAGKLGCNWEFKVAVTAAPNNPPSIQSPPQSPPKYNCTNEMAHAERVFAIAKRLIPYCEQFSKGSVENHVMDAFLDSTRDREVNKASIRKSTVHLRRYMKTCEKRALLGAKADPRCEQMKKLKPRMELLYSEASKLKCYWKVNVSQGSTQPPTDPTTETSTEPTTQPSPQSAAKENCTNQSAHAEKVLVMAKRLLPYCDQARFGSLEFIVLEAFCDATREQNVNKTAIATATANLGKYMKMCEDQESQGVTKHRRCDLMRRMQPHMEELNGEAMKIKCNFKILYDVPVEPSTIPSIPPPTKETCDNESARAETVLKMAKHILPYCDQIVHWRFEKTILEAVCDSTRDNAINKTLIAATTIRLRKYAKMCEKEEKFHGIKPDERCELMAKMRLHMEFLNSQATDLKCNFKSEPKETTARYPPTIKPNPQWSYEQEGAHADKVLDMAQLLLPNCQQFSKESAEGIVLAKFCNLTENNLIHKTEIAKASAAMKGLVNSVCGAAALDGSRCKLLVKMKPKMEKLNKEAMELNYDWHINTGGNSTVDRDVAEARKVFVIQMQFIPSLCDRLEPNSAEQLALAEYCDTTRQGIVDKKKLKEASGALQGLTTSICGADSIKESPRCELVNRMKSRLEQLEKLVLGLIESGYTFNPKSVNPKPQKEQPQTLDEIDQPTTWQQVLLVFSVLIIVVPLTICFLCAIQLFLVLGQF